MHHQMSHDRKSHQKADRIISGLTDRVFFLIIARFRNVAVETYLSSIQVESVALVSRFETLIVLLGNRPRAEMNPTIAK